MYSKIINKCKYQMAHKPSKQKPSCTKKCFSRDTIPPYFKTIHTIPQKTHKNSSMYMATKLTPSRTSTKKGLQTDVFQSLHDTPVRAQCSMASIKGHSKVCATIQAHLQLQLCYSFI